MKSPFPGMDPFIEGCGLWGDFHDALIQDIKNSLGARVPERYLVRTGERGYVVLATEDGQRKRTFIPDVNVTTSRNTAEPETGVALVEPAIENEPYLLRAFIADEFRESYVEILDADKQGRLVTCIEVLSPSNKKENTEGWDLYQRKRQGIFTSGSANLVEIDLLRGGVPMPMVEPWHASPYRLLVFRKSLVPMCRVWRGYFQACLPEIPVPLLKPDSDVLLDLQPIIEAIYARSKYARSIDYTKAIKPLLSADERAWLEQQLRDRAEPA